MHSRRSTARRWAIGSFVTGGVVAAVVVVSMLLSVQERPCTLRYQAPQVGVRLASSDRASIDSVDVELCTEGRCREAVARVVGQRLAVAELDMEPGPARVTVTIGTSAGSRTASTTAPIEVTYPNGPGCGESRRAEVVLTDAGLRPSSTP
jgi:hypothetical protein